MKKLNKKGLESNHCFVQVSYRGVILNGDLIMRNTLLTLFLFSSLLFAKEDNNDPERVIQDFFYHFNEMDINKINELWDLPITYFVGDEIIVAKSYSEIVNYENLKKEGWSYSKINSIDPIVLQEDFVIYKTNFTRYNDQDIELISTDTNITLIKRGDFWKLKIAIIPINISTGK